MKYKYAFKLLQPFYQLHWAPFLFGVILLIIVDVLQLFIPRFIGRSVDSFLYDPSALTTYLLYMGIVAFTMLIGRYWYRELILGTTRRLEAYLRRRLFLHSLCLPLTFYDHNGPGKGMALMTNDITAVRVALGLGSILFVDAIIMGFASFLVMVRMINWELTLWSILPLPLILVVATYMGKSVHDRFRRVQEKFSDLTEFSQEIFSAAKVIKSFAVETTMNERFLQRNKEFIAASMKLTNIQAAYVPITHVLPFGCYAIALYFGGKLIMDGQMTVGDLTAFIGYQGLIIWPVMGLGFLINMVQRGLASLQRIGAFLDQPHYELLAAIEPNKEAVQQAVKIVIRDLTFQYEASPATALQGIMIVIPAGKRVGLVGRTGSGKSTLLRLLLRLYDPPIGSIYLGEKEIHDFSFTELRQLFGYVPQDSKLFSKTIGENIAFDQTYSKTEITAAAYLAAVTEDIDSKPEGFDTELGENGKRLSGGQQQRVAIARAIIKKAPILLLDDVFSALDYETEAQLLKNMELFTQGKTTLIVSQRVAAVTQCDSIVVLDHGEIKEQGTHAELVARRGLYYEIYEQQLLNDKSGAKDSGGHHE